MFQDVKHFYSNEEKLRLYYYVSNFGINQPMLPVISDPGYEHRDPIPLPRPTRYARHYAGR